MTTEKFPKGSRVRYSRSFLRSYATFDDADLSHLRGTVISKCQPEHSNSAYEVYVKWDGGSSGYTLSSNLELLEH
jgi:hypothetical protein